LQAAVQYTLEALHGDCYAPVGHAPDDDDDVQYWHQPNFNRNARSLYITDTDVVTWICIWMWTIIAKLLVDYNECELNHVTNDQPPELHDKQDAASKHFVYM